MSDEERQAIDSKAEAVKEKELGNAAYKSKVGQHIHESHIALL